MNIFIGTSSRDELDKKILNMSDELIEKVAKVPDLNLVYGGYDHGVMKKTPARGSSSPTTAESRSGSRAIR